MVRMFHIILEQNEFDINWNLRIERTSVDGNEQVAVNVVTKMRLLKMITH